MNPISWRAPQFQSGKRMMIADHGGRRLSMRLVRGEWWSVRIDGHDIGCWSGIEQAKEAASLALVRARAKRR